MTTHSYEYHITASQQGIKIVDLLSEESGLSKQVIKSAMQKGAAWMTDEHGTRRVRRKDKRAKPGDQVHLYYNEQILNATTNQAILISDQGEYSAWYKPRGMMSQGSKWGDHCAIDRWVEMQDERHRPAFIVHRLDRFTSGIILLAHSKKVAKQLANNFKARQVRKKYQAIVHGQFPAEFITFDNQLDEKTAITIAKLVCYQDKANRSLLDIEIKTGRKHQIRRHLAEAGFPVIGDRLYGNDNDQDDLQLTACYLQLTCPVDGTSKEFTLDKSLQLF